MENQAICFLNVSVAQGLGPSVKYVRSKGEGGVKGKSVHLFL